MVYILRRATAYFIDCTICYVTIMLIIQWAILSNIREQFGLTDEWFQNSINLQLYVLLTISIPVWLYFTYFDSKKTQGTFGKRLMKLNLLGKNGVRLSIRKSFFRTLLKLLPWEIAHIGIIFPTPLYFSESADIRILTILGMALFVIYALSILISPKGQTPYDLVLATQVAKKA